MKPATSAFCLALLVILFTFASGISASGQDGKLNLRVTPQQAYVFVDGRAISEASKHHSLHLSAGDHKIDLANYGYAPATRTVAIAAGETTDREYRHQYETSEQLPFGSSLQIFDRGKICENPFSLRTVRAAIHG